MLYEPRVADDASPLPVLYRDFWEKQRAVQMRLRFAYPVHMSPSTTKTVHAKKKSASRRRSASSAVAIDPLITKLYEGAVELRIRIAKKDDSSESVSAPLESIDLTLPPAGKYADENDRVAALISSLTSAVLKDIVLAKQKTRKAVQAVGIDRAKSEGKQFGRRALDLDADLFEELCQAYANKEITAEIAGERLGCSYRTFKRRYAKRIALETDTSRVCEDEV